MGGPGLLHARRADLRTVDSSLELHITRSFPQFWRARRTRGGGNDRRIDALVCRFLFFGLIADSTDCKRDPVAADHSPSISVTCLKSFLGPFRLYVYLWDGRAGAVRR